jgi:D-glycero-D-manno-heptose 1,7-bisphosphate phosphatase
MEIGNGWSIFLDRDGVINKKNPFGYITDFNKFFFEENFFEAMSLINSFFEFVFIVTNQRGVGLGLMTEFDLNAIHEEMLSKILFHSGRVDKIYSCTETSDSAFCRKPNIGMGLLAKKNFPNIDFSKSIMVGDSSTDIDFGKRLGMKTVLISKFLLKNYKGSSPDFVFKSLFDFVKLIKVYPINGNLINGN